MDSAYSLYSAAADLARTGHHERAAAMRAQAALAPVVRVMALYPLDDGRVTLQRARLMDRWPAGVVVPGATLTVLDNQGWLWLVTVSEILPERTDREGATQAGYDAMESARAMVVGAKLASPMPSPRETEEGLAITLPLVSGHAHGRSWDKGDIVRIGAGTYKVTHQPRRTDTTEIFRLAPVTEEAYATRPGSVKMGYEEEARQAVGSAIQTPAGDWIHVTKVSFIETRAQYRSRTWYADGKHVSPERAGEINRTHGPTVARWLHAAEGSRVEPPMPTDSAVLIPADPAKRSATGERVAISPSGKILHERVGDPDQLDSWYHYVVEIDNPTLAAHVKAFIAAAKASA